MNIANEILKEVENSGYNCMFADLSTCDDINGLIIRSDGKVFELGETFSNQEKQLKDYSLTELKNIYSKLETFYYLDVKEKFFDNWHNNKNVQWHSIENWYNFDSSVKVNKNVKKGLIKKIIAEIESPQQTILSQWSYLDGFGGYIIRKDGEIFTIGDAGAQALSSDSYCNLNQLSEKELSKIFSNLFPSNDLLNDMKNSPSSFPYSNVNQIITWAQNLPTKSLKLK